MRPLEAPGCHRRLREASGGPRTPQGTPEGPKGPQGVYLGAVFIIRDGMKRFAPILYYDFPIIIGLVAHLLLLLSNPVAILSFRILHDKIHLFFFHAGFFLLEKSYYYIPG